MLYSNNVIVLDIGRYDCKVAQYSTTSNTIRLIKRDVITPLDAYVVDGRLIRVDEFVGDLIKFFDISGFSGKRIHVCSSVLDINTVLDSWIGDDIKSLAQFYQKEKEPNLNKLQTGSWQFYGTELKENSVLNRVAVSTCKSAVIVALYQSFSERGFTLCSVIDTDIALMNLLAMSKDNFDNPSRFIIELGGTTTVSAIVGNIPVDTFKIKAGFGALVKQLATDLGVQEEVARYALFNAGFMDTPVAHAHLEYANIPQDLYYVTLLEFSKKLTREIKLGLESKASVYKMSPYRLMLTGGYAAIPCINEVLCQIFNSDLLLFEDVISEGYEINGKQVSSADGVDLTPQYMLTLGVMLSWNYKIQSNLVQKTGKSIDFTQIVKWGPVAAVSVLAIMLISGGISCISSNGQLKDLTEKDGQVATLQGKITGLQAGVDLMEDNLSVAGNINSTVPKLLKFVTDFPSSKLIIASIDSEGVIKKPTVSVDGDPATEEIGVPEGDLLEEETGSEDISGDMPGEDGMGAEGEDGDGETGSLLDEVTGDPVDDSTMQKLKEKKKYFVRGYSQDYNTAILFFDKLKSSEIAVGVTLNGIDKVTLPSGDITYLFEILVEG